ncbi:zf-HC2 domain-containing protein [Litchfieldia alkalitelluris]|uniref:zf-HC2 domain-containing protein n=1 Tax=Litchfieldia alkalitelluris TaxID=304268 RepID=UPI00147369F8|nr:zf-HC2 domain-containing protein [Litchfieldia alkalitelluris]
MKYPCDLVRDLYPLYEEGDLSPSVKEKVEEHLRECESCRSIYLSGKGFEDDKQQLTKIESTIPESLDNRIILSVKLKRMKFYVAVLISVILIIAVNLYQNQRHEIFSTYNQVYRGAEELNNILLSAPEASGEELSFLKNMFFEEMYEGIENLTQSLNWFEEQKYKGSSLYINQQSFYTTLDNLNLRKKDDRWDEVDQKTYDLLVQYAKSYMQEVEDDYNKFNHGYSSYFEQVDIVGLSGPLMEINKLTYTYNRFHKLPDQMKQLKENEVKTKIASGFRVENEDITLSKYLDYTYRFEIKKRSISGEVDAFTGHPIRMDYFGTVDTDTTGELLDVNQVQDNVIMMLHNIYGKEQQFDVKYLGINVDYSSNIDDQYYTFSYMPVVHSHPIYSISDQSNRIYFDARSGEFRMMHSLHFIPFSLDFNQNVNEVISPEQGLDILKRKVDIEDQELIEKRKYEFIDTFVIYSSTSGGLVLVHAYGPNGHDYDWRYINVENGKEEMFYFEN